jgi:hypothetical protein
MDMSSNTMGSGSSLYLASLLAGGCPLRSLSQ